MQWILKVLKAVAENEVLLCEKAVFAQRSLLEGPPQTRSLHLTVSVLNPCQPIVRGVTSSAWAALRVYGVY